jgi:leucyl-tRNA synthetase
MDDPDWRDENLRDINSKIESFYNLADSIIKMKAKGKAGHLEEWLISMLQHRAKKVAENIEMLKTRTAIENAFYEIWNDFRWYMRRKEENHTETLKEALEIWTCLLAPFMPYVCEEIWNKMGQEGFITSAKWPTFNEKKVNVKAEETEDLVGNVLEDTSNILRATKMTPKRVCYYSAASWKWNIYLKALEKSVVTKIVLSDLMKELMKNAELRKTAEKVAKFSSQTIAEINEMPEEKKRRQLQIGAMDEQETLAEAVKFFEREFNAKISIYREEDSKCHDPKKRAELAKPYRPAIYVE